MATLPITFEQLRITPFPHDELSMTPFPYDFESSTSATTLKSANWFTNVDERLTLDVLYRTRLEGAILRSTGHRYEIEGCKDPPYIRMKTIATFALSPPYSYINLYHHSGRITFGFSSGSWVRIQFGQIWSQKCIYSVLPARGTERQDQENLDTDPATAVVTAMHDNNCQQSLCTGSGRMFSSADDVEVINVADYLSYHPTTCPSTPTDLGLQVLERDLGLGDLAP